jgi:hypothetical protein
MDTEIPPFQKGEYIILTRPYHGLPVGSVGMITAVEDTNPPRYHVHFGQSLPSGPIPQNHFARLKPAKPNDSPPHPPETDSPDE